MRAWLPEVPPETDLAISLTGARQRADRAPGDRR